MGPCVAEVVRFTGGWLFDQVMAGWDVWVLTPEHPDCRPLQILGVRSADLESSLARMVKVPCLQIIALRADLYGQDERIRRLVLDTAADSQADVRLWGGQWPPGLDDTAGPVQHRLSVAARAFKAQALAATAAPAGAGGAGPAGAGGGPAGAEAAEAELFRRFRAAEKATDGHVLVGKNLLRGHEKQPPCSPCRESSWSPWSKRSPRRSAPAISAISVRGSSRSRTATAVTSPGTTTTW